VNIEELSAFATQVAKGLSGLEESARRSRTESRTHLVSPNTPVTRFSTGGCVPTLDEDTASLSSSRIVHINTSKDRRPASARAPAQRHLDGVVLLASVINERSTLSRPRGLCLTYSSPNWADCTPGGPPPFFYKLPPAIPHLALWPTGGVGIFSNGQSLKYFQACDVAVLMTRERGEKVCGTETVNDVGHILHYEMG
jgi:hypothetical protein